MTRTPLLAGLVPALVLGLGACAGGPEQASPEGPDGRLTGSPVELLTGPLYDEIALLEDRRDAGSGRLIELLGNGDARVRARAALALGRMDARDHGSDVTNALCQALDDPRPRVRYTVAFALGQRAHSDSAGVLAAYRNDPDPLMRARVVEALSKHPGDALHAELSVALRDADLRVRIEAAVGAGRWDSDEAGAEAIDRALVDALSPYEISDRDRELGRREVETELAWRILYALSRRGAELGRGAFLEYLQSRQPLERLFSAKGLGRIEPSAESIEALGRTLADERDQAHPDWRVSYEAAFSLGALADPTGLEALLEAREYSNPHVRAAVFEALGKFPEQSKEVVPSLRRGLLDVSPAVRVAALGAISGVLDPGEGLATLERFVRDSDPVVRAGVASALGRIDLPGSVTLLQGLLRDSNTRVATSAVLAPGGISDESARAALHAALEHPDNGIKLSAVYALRNHPDPFDLGPLVAAFGAARGDISTEIAFNVLENLREVQGAAGDALLGAALEDPRPHVRRVAWAVLTESRGRELDPLEGHPSSTEPPPRPGKDFPLWTRNPLVEIRTSKGPMVFELFPAEAPIHVFSFLRLAERGHYEQLGFHRVVSDFVIQGGDYRGDGNGATPWRGEALRQEISPRKYVRGSLGMPRNEDMESGGSQIFVTHRPTPHLDGRYTIFGELRAGADVLDRIQVGDRILEITLLR